MYFQLLECKYIYFSLTVPKIQTSIHWKCVHNSGQLLIVSSWSCKYSIPKKSGRETMNQQKCCKSVLYAFKMWRENTFNVSAHIRIGSKVGSHCVQYDMMIQCHRFGSNGHNFYLLSYHRKLCFFINIYRIDVAISSKDIDKNRNCKYQELYIVKHKEQIYFHYRTLYLSQEHACTLYVYISIWIKNICLATESISATLR